MRNLAYETRLCDPLPENHSYRATLRNFGASVELSVRSVPADEMARHLHTQVPVWLLEPKPLSDEEIERRKEENAKRAGNRAKQAVRWLLKAMQADHLLTLTYRENVEDIERVGKDWQKFVRLVRVKYPNWRFVCCRERQERGAWHLHIGIRGRGDVHWLRRCWWMALGHRVEIDYSPEGKKQLRALVKDGREWRYAKPEEVRGAIHLRGPSKRWGGDGQRWDTEKLSAYMTKYITKSFEGLQGRRYWPSKHIQRPEAQKFWLVAASFDAAVREAHDMLRNRHCCRTLRIWSSDDMTRIWFSGSDIECPF